MSLELVEMDDGYVKELLGLEIEDGETVCIIKITCEPELPHPFTAEVFSETISHLEDCDRSLAKVLSRVGKFVIAQRKKNGMRTRI